VIQGSKSVIQKQFGTDENFDVIINPDKGDFEIYRNRTVVEDADLTDLNTEIAISSANVNDGDYELGEEFTDTIRFSDFGRRAILNLRQNLASRILELEKDNIYQK